MEVGDDVPLAHLHTHRGLGKLGLQALLPTACPMECPGLCPGHCDSPETAALSSDLDSSPHCPLSAPQPAFPPPDFVEAVLSTMNRSQVDGSWVLAVLRSRGRCTEWGSQQVDPGARRPGLRAHSALAAQGEFVCIHRNPASVSWATPRVTTILELEAGKAGETHDPCVSRGHPPSLRVCPCFKLVGTGPR